MSRFIDIHADKRKALKLFQSVEPKVELVGRTYFDPSVSYEGVIEEDITPDEVPGFVARMSHQSTGSRTDNIKLTKNLLKFNPPHKTPFEFMTWVFRITGVSKSCLTQMDRNRVGVGFVQMSGRYMDSSERGFVYTAFAEKPWEIDGSDIEKSAVCGLMHEQLHFGVCLDAYKFARSNGQTKQDSRKKLPMSMATGTYVYYNSSALKGWFNERLRPQAEWEHIRVAQMVFDIVYSIAPAHFEAEKILLDGSL